MSAILKFPESMFVDGDDCGEPMSADDLCSALHVWVMQNPDTLIDAVVEACANGDLLFLQRQVERHVTGWRTP